jgi:hypothetical protein
MASLLYVLGYLVWSLNAAVNNLGLLPAIDSQYFVAGIVPALIALLVYFVIRAIKSWRNRLRKWFEQNPGSWSRLVVRVVLGAFLVVTAYAIIFQYEPYRYWLILGLPSFLFVDFILGQQDKATQILTSFYTYLIPLLIGVGGIILYVFAIYPFIPQELGGIRPRCAHLDVVAGQLSDEVSQVLLPVMPTSASQVVQSTQVNVLFSSGDFLLVRPIAAQPGMRERRIFEIRRSALQAITWCGQGSH